MKLCTNDEYGYYSLYIKLEVSLQLVFAHIFYLSFLQLYLISALLLKLCEYYSLHAFQMFITFTYLLKVTLGTSYVHNKQTIPVYNNLRYLNDLNLDSSAHTYHK